MSSYTCVHGVQTFGPDAKRCVECEATSRQHMDAIFDAHAAPPSAPAEKRKGRQ